MRRIGDGRRKRRVLRDSKTFMEFLFSSDGSGQKQISFRKGISAIERAGMKVVVDRGRKLFSRRRRRAYRISSSRCLSFYLTDTRSLGL
jgi:hypothetical protein